MLRYRIAPLQSICRTIFAKGKPRRATPLESTRYTSTTSCRLHLPRRGVSANPNDRYHAKEESESSPFGEYVKSTIKAVVAAHVGTETATPTTAIDRYAERSQWRAIVDELLQALRRFDRLSLSSWVLNSACDEQQFLLAKSYVDFMEADEPGSTLSLARVFSVLDLIGTYLLAHPNAADHDRLWSEADVFRYCGAVEGMLDVMDVQSMGSVLKALAATSRWDDAIAKATSYHTSSFRLPPTAREAVVVGAFRNGDHYRALHLVETLIDERLGFRTLESLVHNAWLDSTMRSATENDNNRSESSAVHEAGFKRLMEEMRTTRCFPQLKMLQRTVAEFLPHWTLRLTEASNDGKCEACRRQLPPLVVTSEDFLQLSRLFMQRVLIGDDIYEHSSPAEITRFRGFLMQWAPFDMVIDALNVSFTRTKVRPTRQELAANLRLMLEHVKRSKRNRRILVIGRKHMRSWPPAEFQRISSMARLYLVENASSDDVFSLAAALASGPECTVVSNDFYRDHAFRLALRNVDLHVRRVFDRWIRSVQMTPSGYRPRDGSFALHPPVRHDTVIHYTESPPCWHLPILSGSPLGRFGLPEEWACLVRSAR